MAENDQILDWMLFNTDELWRTACSTVDAMAKYPGSEEPNECGFSMAHRTQLDMFSYFSQNPESLRRFANAMRFFTTRPGLEPYHVVENFAWDTLPDGGVVVDVGGSHGLIPIAIARKFPNLKFIVQDLDEPVIRNADAKKPADVADRVSFMVHDFFKEQPIKSADVYFFRAILHNWGDKHVVKILQNLIPALKPGARIVINDQVIPEPGTMPKMLEARIRSSDLTMVEIHNGQDREMHEWAKLFETVDPRFHFLGGRQPQGSRMFILVAEWKGN
jgi:SAM-dependent methyltransferase